MPIIMANHCWRSRQFADSFRIDNIDILSRWDAPSTSHSSSAIQGSNDKSKHDIHFSLDLKKCMVNASYIHSIPLATDNTIVVLPRLSTPPHFSILSPTIRQPFSMFCNVTATFHTIGKHSGANSWTVGILPRRIRLLRMGVGAYIATFSMTLREYMRIHVERARWQSFVHLLIFIFYLFFKKCTHF